MPRQKNKNKYRSKFEARFAKFLERLGIIFCFEKAKIPFIVPAQNRTYTPDFIYDPRKKSPVDPKKFLTLEELKGKIIIETKGLLTTADRKKMLLVKEQHPDLDIRFVFMQDKPLYKGSKTRYSDWCKKHDFKYHIGEEPPKRWLTSKNPY